MFCCLLRFIVTRRRKKVHYWEVNPYKKVATFCKLFLCTLVDQGVHHFLFISDKHNVKQSKTSYKIISIKSIYYVLWFFKDIQYCREKCGHHEQSCELKQLLFLRVYLSGSSSRDVSHCFGFADNYLTLVLDCIRKKPKLVFSIFVENKSLFVSVLLWRSFRVMLLTKLNW